MPDAALDHLVIAARTLEEGVAWCEATLGVSPAAGGRHALMGTHNRVFAVATETFPRAYFELIAIDPDATPPGRTRWFDLDDAVLQATLERGPQLVAWVARVGDLDAALQALAALGIDAGRKLQASRMTPQGELRWRIAVRDDGARLIGRRAADADRVGRWAPRRCAACGRGDARFDHTERAGCISRIGIAGRAAIARARSLRRCVGCCRNAQARLPVRYRPQPKRVPAISISLDTPRGRVRLTSPY